MNNVMTFTIDTKEPIPLELFNKSLESFKKEFYSVTQSSSELYIKEIRKGSIEIDLLTIAGAVATVLPILESTNAIGQFVEYVQKTAKWLSGESSKPKDIRYSMDEIKNFHDMFSPIAKAKDDNAEIRFTTEGYEPISVGKAKVVKMIQYKGVAFQICNENTNDNSIVNSYSKVLFYWYQTGFDENKINTGNKGKIEVIDSKPHKVVFADDDSTTKKEMTTVHPILGVDWQMVGYFVDVEVIRKDGEIVAYKIIQNYMNDAIV